MAEPSERIALWANGVAEQIARAEPEQNDIERTRGPNTADLRPSLRVAEHHWMIPRQHEKSPDVIVIGSSRLSVAAHHHAPTNKRRS
jgi:hypothetical protein